MLRPFLLTTILLVGSAVFHSSFSVAQNRDSDSTTATVRSNTQAAKASAANAIEIAIDRAIEFLKKSQGADGAWHAEQYGSMKQGAAVTAITLYGLSHLSEEELKLARKNQLIEKAAAFLHKGLKQSNCVANPDGSLDFSVYGTALILTAHKKLDLGLSDIHVTKMVEYLQASQCAESRGFKPTSPNYGGWDILGPGSTSGKSSGPNVSVTFYVLEALSLYPNPKNAVVFGRAKKWVDRIAAATPKGGFYFTSQSESTLNKAGRDGGEGQIPLAYGSATCDGLGIQLLTGAKLQTGAASESVEWLKSNLVFDEVPGFAKSDESGWNKGLQFYYLAGLSRCLKQFAGENEFAKRSLATAVVGLQRENGSWQNTANQMREDEALIATSFALIALANSRSQVATEKK